MIWYDFEWDVIIKSNWSPISLSNGVLIVYNLRIINYHKQELYFSELYKLVLSVIFCGFGWEIYDMNSGLIASQMILNNSKVIECR